MTNYIVLIDRIMIKKIVYLLCITKFGSSMKYIIKQQAIQIKVNAFLPLHKFHQYATARLHTITFTTQSSQNNLYEVSYP